ncbi:MAG: sensor histidine kinase N-terminal domain-containing protein [Pseudomonadota bacterium]
MSDTVTIRGSIGRRLLILLLSGAVVLAFALYYMFQSLAVQLAEESQDNILRASATAILDTASVRNGQLDLDLPYSAFSMLSNVSNDRVFYSVIAGNDFLTGYNDLPLPESADNQIAFSTADYRGAEVRVVVMQRVLSVERRPVTLRVAVAQTRDGQRELIADISQIAATVGVAVFLLVVILGVITARTTINPMIRLTESISRRGPNDLRPVSTPVPSEMAPLVSALNRFMDRLKISLSRTEEFVADAAHRVRTPLATVRTRAEATLLRVEKEENRAAMREMIRAIDESSRAAGQMLDHAMVTLRADDLDRTTVDLNQVVAELTERLSPLADLRDIDLAFKAAAPLNVQGDPILIQSALRNVLDNAIKYSPPESTVTLTLDAKDGFATLRVQDQGAGFPKGQTQDLVERFKRGANVEGTVGSGLGLTIAADVAKAHGGRLDLTNIEGDGACAALFFPLS